jgi:hypothetical protein
MKTKLILWLVMVVVVGSGVTLLAIHLYQWREAAQAQQPIQAATTNVMVRLKPDPSPAISPTH